MDWIEISVRNAGVPTLVSFLVTAVTLYVSYKQGKKKQKVDDFSAITGTATGLIKSLQEERTDLNNERHELKKEISKLETRVKELETENTKLRKQVEKLENQNENLAAEIEKIKKKL